MSFKTMHVLQEGPANALALNRENNQVVIAGRNVFKVFTIEEDEFVESCNLRVGKNLNLNFSCNDVAWNILEDHILATAATNGAVVLWNLGRPSRSKQEHVFMDHKRTVNKVSFHTSESSLLISGSQDGTMKCFDLRMKEATRTFMSNTESIRDVQFSPHQHHAFAAVSENGNVQLWDIRRPDRCCHQYTAHSGPVFACDWHPEVNWLATASRDKTIKHSEGCTGKGTNVLCLCDQVWDLTNKPTLEHTINTIASVGRIKWRPQHKFHIASCALVVDCSINVWDIRRPYIPFAAFKEHKDVATGIAWRGDPQVFLSVSRDCTLYQHAFKDATRPANQANPQGISLNCHGDVAYACRIHPNVPYPAKLHGGYLRKTAINSEQFCQAASSMHWFSMKPARESRWLLESARRYVLSGRSLTEMCDHNAAVARDLGRHQVSLVWSIIRTLYWSARGGPGDPNSAGTLRDDASVAGEIIPVGGTPCDSDQRTSRNAVSAGPVPVHVQAAAVNVDGTVSGSVQTDGGVGEADEDTETDETTEIFQNGVHLRLPSFSKTPMTQGDFFFGDGEMDPLDVDAGMGVGASVGVGGVIMSGTGSVSSQVGQSGGPSDEWMLPSEAFPLRHEILDRSPPPETFPNHLEPSEQETQTVAVEEQPAPLLNVSALAVPIMLDCGKIVADALCHHAALGDIQMAASALLVLGDKRRTLGLDEATQEHWLLGYIDWLARHKLWDVATQVIQLSWLPNVCQLNQQSTTLHTSCGNCQKPLLRTGWLCDRCHSSESASCCVCHQVVRGLYAWCQGCSHGGHIHHIQQWLSLNRHCPAGCGHICEYV